MSNALEQLRIDSTEPQFFRARVAYLKAELICAEFRSKNEEATTVSLLFDVTDLQNKLVPNYCAVIRREGVESFLIKFPEAKLIEEFEGSFIEWREFNELLLRRFEQAYDICDLLGQREAQRVQDEKPDHPYGFAKHLHMQELSSELVHTQAARALSVKDRLLLRLIGRCHDLGRHCEALLLPEELPLGGHARLSVDLLDKAGLEAYLYQDDWTDLRQAVLWHSQQQVRSKSKRARQLCYILRDSDKLEIFNSALYFSSRGIAEQMKLFYSTESEIDLSIENLQNQIFALLRSESALLPLARAIKPFLYADVSQRSLELFCNGSTLSLDVVRLSYPDYVLYQLAMIFDVQSDKVLEQALPGIENRIAFLRRYSSAEIASISQSAAAREIAERLPGFSFRQLMLRFSAAEFDPDSFES